MKRLSQPSIDHMLNTFSLRWYEGTTCPHCLQFVHLNNIKMPSSGAIALVIVAKHIQAHPEKKWIHVTNLLNHMNIPAAIKNTGAFSKLKYWELIEYLPERRIEDNSPKQGYWGITQKGHEFVRGQIQLPERALFYDDRFVKYEGDPVGIKHVIQSGKHKFNWEEVIHWADKFEGRLV